MLKTTASPKDRGSDGDVENKEDNGDGIDEK